MMYQYFPVPSCRMGALWALSDIENACIIEFGPAGTTHFSLEGMSNLNGDPKAHAFSTHISERDLTFGDTKRLEQAILEVDAIRKPDYIFVMASTLTAIIGIDLESTCELLIDQVNAKLIPIKSDGFKGDFTYGVREILTALATHVVNGTGVALPKTYNLIGSTMDGYSARSDVKALSRMMAHFYGATCNTVFTSDTGMSKLQSAGDVSLNISLRTEAVDACDVLLDRFGTPYVSVLPYGLEGIEAFCLGVEAATGWQRDDSAYRAFKMNASGIHRRIKHLTEETQAKVMVSGNFDSVKGIMTILKACGIEDALGLIVHKINKNALNDLPYPAMENVTEGDKKDALNAFRPSIVLGDGVLLTFAKEIVPGAKCTQIAHPNLDKALIHHEVPHMGIDGLHYTCELLLNAIPS